MRPLFLSGTARGGTNLAIMMASAHSQINLSQDPFLPLFKYFKATLLNEDITNSLLNPLEEYYYSSKAIKKMHKVLNSNFHVPLAKNHFSQLKDLLSSRMSLSSPRLKENLDLINGSTFDEFLISGIKAISLLKDNTANEIVWAGFNDNWSTEFFGPLSNSFPNAKFISIIRDGRDALSSHMRMLQAQHVNPLYKYKKKKSMLALSLSFIRCWRKHIAFSIYYKKLLGDNFLIMRYEDIVNNSKKSMSQLCDFLDVKYEKNMIDANKLISGDGNIWKPNSNHNSNNQNGIYKKSVNNWKTNLPESVSEMFNYSSSLELHLAGYKDILEYKFGYFPIKSYHQNAKEIESWEGTSFGWRTDNNNNDFDINCEFERKAIIDNKKIIKDNLKLSKYFLFPEVYNCFLKNELII